MKNKTYITLLIIDSIFDKTDGEILAHKFFFIGDACANYQYYFTNNSDKLQQSIDDLAGTINTEINAERHPDFVHILQKYNFEPRSYDLWNEIMQLEVESAFKINANPTLLTLLQTIINQGIFTRESFKGQGAVIRHNFESVLQDPRFEAWVGLIQYLADLFQGEAATPPPLSPTPNPTIDVTEHTEHTEHGPNFEPNPNPFQITPNPAHQGFNVPFNVPLMNGPASHTSHTSQVDSHFVDSHFVDYEQPPPPPED